VCPGRSPADAVRLHRGRHDDVLWAHATDGRHVAVDDERRGASGQSYLGTMPTPDGRSRAWATSLETGDRTILWRYQTTGQLVLWR